MAKGQVDAIQVRIEGLKALDRALGKADVSLRVALRGELKDVASIVSREAQTIADQKGLRRSGDLIRGIKPFALTGRAGVRSTAIHRGYPYPKRLEFEGRGSDGYGPDATLLPAVDAKAGELQTRAELLLDRFVDEAAS